MNDRNDTPPANAARKRAQNHFAASEVRDTAVKAEIARERQLSDAKTAKLRALRLAKEEQDRLELAANPPPPKAAKKTKKAKPAAAVAPVVK
jgi:hypothetical protein